MGRRGRLRVKNPDWPRRVDRADKQGNRGAVASANSLPDSSIDRVSGPLLSGHGLSQRARKRAFAVQFCGTRNRRPCKSKNVWQKLLTGRTAAETTRDLTQLLKLFQNRPRRVMADNA